MAWGQHLVLMERIKYVKREVREHAYLALVCLQLEPAGQWGVPMAQPQSSRREMKLGSTLLQDAVMGPLLLPGAFAQ